MEKVNVVFNWIGTNMFLIVIVAILTVVLIVTILRFLGKPRTEQIDTFKKWLLYAVCEAEKNLGTKTGELKLMAVYEAAVKTFPWVKIFITFEQFKEYVDDALDEMKVLLDTNTSVKEYIEGEVETQPPEEGGADE